MGLTNKKITKTVYITPEQNQALNELSEITKVPQSEFIREGIALALEKYKKLVKEQKPLFATRG